MAGQIVVGVDGSASAAAAVEWAADDAVRSGAALKLVHVQEPWAVTAPLPTAGGIEESLAGHAEDLLEAAAQQARKHAPDIEVRTVRATGSVAERLRSESEQADALVIGSRGVGGFSGLVLGSVGLALAGHAAGPVVVVHEPARTVRGLVVVGFDASRQSQAALEYAFAQARSRGARLQAVHAWQLPVFSSYAMGYVPASEGVFEEENRAARQFLTPWRERYPEVEVEEEIVCGHPVPVLVTASRDADLVVVGSRGQGGIRAAVLGSVSHGVLHRAHCPIAVVRPREDGVQT